MTAPCRFVAAADDEMVPPAAVWRAMTLYPEALKRQKVLRRASAGAAPIGHMGAFRRESAALWPEILG